jgi:chemotaxis protein CheX
MRVEYINPFVDSAIQILKETVTEDVRKGELSLSANMNPMLGVLVLVGLAGQVSGRIIFDMSRDTALKIASVMNNETMTEFDELSIGTLTELANMITGKAVTKLHELGFQFDLTPPAFLTGQNIHLSDNKVEALVVPLEIPQGRIEINVGIREN